MKINNSRYDDIYSVDKEENEPDDLYELSINKKLSFESNTSLCNVKSVQILDESIFHLTHSGKQSESSRKEDKLVKQKSKVELCCQIFEEKIKGVVGEKKLLRCPSASISQKQANEKKIAALETEIELREKIICNMRSKLEEMDSKLKKLEKRKLRRNKLRQHKFRRLFMLHNDQFTISRCAAKTNPPTNSARKRICSVNLNYNLQDTKKEDSKISSAIQIEVESFTPKKVTEIRIPSKMSNNEKIHAKAQHELSFLKYERVPVSTSKKGDSANSKPKISNCDSTLNGLRINRDLNSTFNYTLTTKNQSNETKNISKLDLTSYLTQLNNTVMSSSSTNKDRHINFKQGQTKLLANNMEKISKREHTKSSLY